MYQLTKVFVSELSLSSLHDPEYLRIFKCGHTLFCICLKDWKAEQAFMMSEKKNPATLPGSDILP